MSFQTLSIVPVSITLSALAQISMELGMTWLGVQAALGGTDITLMIWSVVANAAVIGGNALYVVGVGFWLWVLSKTDVSQSYPVVSVSFLLTTFFAYLFLGGVGRRIQNHRDRFGARWDESGRARLKTPGTGNG